MGEDGTGVLLRTWAHLGLQALGDAREEIDALNVFPVPDADTGTNLYLTQQAACAAMDEALAGDPGLLADARGLGAALAQGALLGAHGNSGIILSQLTRGFVAGLVDGEGAGATEADTPAQALARALRVAASSAYDAVATPVEGTVLTVARVAAERAESAAAGAADAAAVVREAVEAAREALARTPTQLATLARAGVVDSGGRGLVVLYDALEEAITGVRRHRAEPWPRPVRSEPCERDDEPYTGGAYEVMYLVDVADEAARGLRTALAGLGDSVVVVGGSGLWNVHVHTDDPGAAVEAGLQAGRPYRIRITHLALGGGHRTVTGRAMIVVTHGPGTAALVERAGGRVVEAGALLPPSTEELHDAIAGAGPAEVVLLTSDTETRPTAEAAARQARQEGLRVAVIPTRSIVQSLAAAAVHDPASGFDDDVIAMTRAASATRYGAVTVAAHEAITMAGTCRPGDVLGVIEGDVAEIGDSQVEVAQRVLDRLLSAGGEIATLVTGEDSTPALVAAVRRHLRHDHPGVELVVHDGGQPHWPLIVGVE